MPNIRLKEVAASVLSYLQKFHSQKKTFIAWITALPTIEVETKPSLDLAVAEAEKLGVQFEHINVSDPKNLASTFREIEARGCDSIVLGGMLIPKGILSR